MTQRDRASEDVDLGGVEIQSSDAAQHLRGERFVDLEEVDVVDGQLGPVEDRDDRIDRGKEEVARLSAGDRLRRRCRAIGGAPHSSARAAEATTSIAAPSPRLDELPAVTMPSGSNAGASRARPSEVASDRGPSSARTVGPAPPLADDLHGHDLGGERLRRLRGHRPPVAFQGVSVEVAAVEAAHLAGPLGGLAHRPAFEGAGQTVVEQGVDQRPVAELPAGPPAPEQVRRVAHAFHAAGHDQVGVARPDRRRGEHDRANPTRRPC